MTLTTPPKQGGVLSVYHTDSNVAIFDLTGALDPDLSEGARGLLWRILALSKKHGPSWLIWLHDIASEGVDSLDTLKEYMRELREVGYIRRFRDNSGPSGTIVWHTQAAERPIFENDAIKPGFEVWQQPVPVEKKPKESKPKKPKKETLRGYKEILDWWKRPASEGGRGQVVAPKQYGRLGVAINELLVVAHGRGWITETSEVQDFIDLAEDCLAWIADDKYRGQPTMDNLSKRIQVWYDMTQGSMANTPAVHMPVSIR